MNINKFSTKVKIFLKAGLISLGVMFVFLSLPVFVNAVAGDPVTDPNFEIVSRDCGKTDASGAINRECGWSDFLDLINRMMRYVIFLSASVAVLSFAYAGFLYVTAFGEMGKVEQAHGIFKATITGMVVIMLAWLIVATILKVFEVGPDFTILDVGNVQTVTK